ncbi:MAG TPA: hypothetical protein PKC40_01440 [Saprospiraceae bacterium]|nr:hypothetical protein [Saprospiraceae bacterium]
MGHEYPFDLEIFGPYNCDEIEEIFDSVFLAPLDNEMWEVLNSNSILEAKGEVYVSKFENKGKDDIIFGREEPWLGITLLQTYFRFDSFGFLRYDNVNSGNSNEWAPIVYDTVCSGENRYSFIFREEKGAFDEFDYCVITYFYEEFQSNYTDSLNENTDFQYLHDKYPHVFSYVYFLGHPYFLFKKNKNKFEKGDYQLFEQELKKTYEFYKDKPELFKKNRFKE